MTEESDAWEEEYLCKGAVWGGAVHHLPLLLPGSRVLELGCGNGKTLSAMIGRSWDVTAIDFSVSAVAMSRMNTGMLQRGDVCVADARSLPFAPERFDAVFAIHILSHLQKNDRTRAAEEAVRVLKTGGILYFSGFSTEDFRYGKGSAVEDGTVMRGSGISTHYFTEQETQLLFCNLTSEAITTERWSMRVRGQDFCRAEVQAVFIK
ncbi:MAG: class I SAM-dependent methyltransferase [Methanoregula sp.]|nr:class I SAM-dependent methyltransferase [Methanoregula sp.]